MKDAVILTGDESLFLIMSAALGEVGLSCGALGERSCKILIADADNETVIKALESVRRQALIVVSRNPARLSEMGADAVLFRPICTKDFVACVLELIRKKEKIQKPRAPRKDKIVLDKNNRTVMLGGDSIRLSANELAVFSLLHENRGEAVKREAIERVLNGDGTNAADVYICYLRRKLEGGGKRVIVSVRGVGYKLL